MNWTELQITDKTGKIGWLTAASPMSVQSEVKNLMRHVKAIRAKHPLYASSRNLPSVAPSIAIKWKRRTSINSESMREPMTKH